MAKYVVVEFVDEKFVTVVPRAWCEADHGSLTCFWPNFGAQEKAKNEVHADKQKWSKRPIRVLRYADDYAEGEVLMTMANVTSGLDKSNLDKYHVGSPTEIKERNGPSSNQDVEENKETWISGSDQEREVDVDSFFPGRIEAPLATVTDSNQVFQRKVIAELGALKEMVALLFDRLPRPAYADEDRILPSPIPDLVKLDVMDLQLSDPGFRSKTIRQLSTIGGKNLSDCAKRILRTIATCDVWAKFSLKGRKGKRSFEKLAMCEVVIRACQNNNQGWRKRAIEDAIAEMLKHSPRRKLKKSEDTAPVEE